MLLALKIAFLKKLHLVLLITFSEDSAMNSIMVNVEGILM